ncbi:hypothetical protein BHM03_00001405 [Ensete ventricosum]|nr:hypothetical protein BHM03_00001405 [Ensete ventricosum]
MSPFRSAILDLELNFSHLLRFASNRFKLCNSFLFRCSSWASACREHVLASGGTMAWSRSTGNVEIEEDRTSRFSLGSTPKRPPKERPRLSSISPDPPPSVPSPCPPPPAPNRLNKSFWQPSAPTEGFSSIAKPHEPLAKSNFYLTVLKIRRSKTRGSHEREERQTRKLGSLAGGRILKLKNPRKRNRATQNRLPRNGFYPTETTDLVIAGDRNKNLRKNSEKDAVRHERTGAEKRISQRWRARLPSPVHVVGPLVRYRLPNYPPLRPMLYKIRVSLEPAWVGGAMPRPVSAGFTNKKKRTNHRCLTRSSLSAHPSLFSELFGGPRWSPRAFLQSQPSEGACVGTHVEEMGAYRKRVTQELHATWRTVTGRQHQ